MHLPSLQQLRYLVALAEHRHFGRAAAACCVSQPALSTGIKDLEETLRARLVDRTSRRVAITPLGQQVATRARLILDQALSLTRLPRQDLPEAAD
ncbi:MAG: hypothetical protein OHK0024_10610 [Thalassobaculales bacterium]